MGLKPVTRDRLHGAALTLVLLGGAGCGGEFPAARGEASGPAPRGALVGQEPVPRVHLFENHSSSLIAWRRAGVQDRVLVHIDAYSDLDWLPDETVARLATARPSELGNLERHPYAMDGGALSRFATWNFVYPAARLGLVRELVWVVPDGTLDSRAAANRLIRSALIGRVQGIRLEEARTLRFEGGVVRGAVLGLPLTICERDALPTFDEPVLLDIDLGYFTTRSASTLYVTNHPWITPRELLQTLRDKQLRTDMATISMSTIGGFVPPKDRWIGGTLGRMLRFADAGRERIERERLELSAAEQAGELDRAVRGYRRLVARDPEDAALWFALAEALESSGSPEHAELARKRAARLDPMLEHGHLFIADRLWNNEGYEAALARYERYLELQPDGPFSVYALRRRAGCLMRLGHSLEAIEEFRRVVRLAPDHADSRFDLGILLREQGEVEQALVQLRAARRILPDWATYSRALGTTYLLDGMLREGVEELERAVARQPCLASARGNLSAALLRLGRYDEAAQHLRVALAFEPGDPRLVTMARQLGQRGIQIAANPP